MVLLINFIMKKLNLYGFFSTHIEIFSLLYEPQKYASSNLHYVQMLFRTEKNSSSISIHYLNYYPVF